MLSDVSVCVHTSMHTAIPNSKASHCFHIARISDVESQHGDPDQPPPTPPKKK